MTINQHFQQWVAIFLIIGFLAPTYILFTAKEARADVPVADWKGWIQWAITAVKATISAAQDILTAGNTGALVTKEYILDGIAYALAGQMLRLLTNSIVNWIKTGGVNGGGLNITNFADAFKQELDNQAGLFLEQYLGSSNMSLLCSPFRIQLGNLVGSSIAQSTSGNFSQKARCTISQIANNLENFSIDFSNGGWSSWNQALEPAGNWMGSYLLAIDEYQNRANQAADNLKTDMLTTGGGLLSQKKCDTTPEGNLTNCKIITPGSIVAESVKQTFNIDVDRLKVADEINEIVAAGLSALVSWALTGGGGFDNYDGAKFNQQTSADTIPPNIVITSPSDNSLVNGTVSISATVYDNVGVASVKFYVNGVLLDEKTAPPFSVNWDPATAGTPTVDIKVDATDTSGNVSSAAITVNVVASQSQAQLTISIGQPADGATVSGRSVNITSLVSGVSGGLSVSYLIDNSAQLIGQYRSPYRAVWDTRSYQNGPHIIQAQVTDASGARATSTPISVNVAN